MFRRWMLILLFSLCLTGWTACANDQRMIEEHQQAIDAEEE